MCLFIRPFYLRVQDFEAVGYSRSKVSDLDDEELFALVKTFERFGSQYRVHPRPGMWMTSLCCQSILLTIF